MKTRIYYHHTDCGGVVYYANYEFIQGANNLWTVKINEPSLIVPTLIKRNDGWYEADANMFPNGKSTDGKNASDRYFWQVDGGTYLGLLQRDDVDCRRVVYANRRPSIRRRVLVYE